MGESLGDAAGVGGRSEAIPGAGDNAIYDNEVTVAIIPHTYASTSLRTLTPGAALNVEVDVLSKYAERQQKQSTESFTLTEQYLMANGY